MDNTHDTQDRTGIATWLAVFGSGIALGVVIGIAFAPARGRETREAIARATRDGRDRAEKLMSRGREAAVRQQERVNRLANTAGDYVRSARRTVGEQTQAVKSAIDRARGGAKIDEARTGDSIA